ncbi:hypothetical protein NIES4102_16690 [Chondrocystis sp. NIES-4102]|nr:hypothetical protein NIES4102_16690 [Chondrocystis sp. NIES-4102]
MYSNYTVDNRPTLMRRIITLVTIIAAFGTNIFANVNPPNGLTIGEISNKFFNDILITPANYAFAIWGIIYLGLISLAVYQFLPAQKNNILLQRLGYKLAIASTAQIVWVICFLYRQYAVSFLAMLAILLPLISAYWCLPFNRSVAQKDKYFICIPISIYLSWISVATIVNGATVLESWKWNGWGISGVIWTIIMLLVAALITHLVSIPRRDFAYAGVFIWALIAIAVKNADTMIISGTAIGLSLTLLILLLSFSFYAPIRGTN